MVFSLYGNVCSCFSLSFSTHTHTHIQLATHMQNRAHVYSCAFMHTLAHSRRGVGRGLLDSRAGAFLAIMGQLDRTHTHKFPLYRELKCRVRPLKLRKGCFCRTHPKPHWGLICRVIQSDLLVKTKTSFIDSDCLCKLHKILKKLECSFYPQLEFIGFLYMYTTKKVKCKMNRYSVSTFFLNLRLRISFCPTVYLMNRTIPVQIKMLLISL